MSDPLIFLSEASLPSGVKKIKYLSEAIESGKLGPNEAAEAYFHKGVILSGFPSKGSRKKAAEAFRKACEMNPALKEAYYNLGVLMHRMGDDDEALEAFAGALAADPVHRHSLDGAARSLFEKGSKMEALSVLEALAAWREFPGSFRGKAWASCGEIHSK